MKAIMVILFVLGAFVFFVDISKATDWKTDPTLCPITYNGQKGDPGTVMCGLSGVSALWYDMLSLYNASSTLLTTSTNNTSYVYGGYVVDCQAYDSNPSGGYCNNYGNFWCSPASSCNILHVKTVCTANKWASASGASSCDTSSGDTKCMTGWLDCNGGSDCEVENGGTCFVNMGGSSVTGTYSGCTCVPDSQNFITGNMATASTTFDSPLLWGRQYGAGDLLNITRNGVATSSFVVFNSGQVAIGHNINISTTSVAFEVSSTDRGILIPRFSTFNPLFTPEAGELYYNTGENKFKYFNGSAWSDLGGGSSWTTTTLLSVTGNATGLYPVGTVSTTIGIGSTGADLWLQTSSTPRIYVAENGNVGIGTTTPSERLSVVGNISNLISQDSGVEIISSLTVGSNLGTIEISGKYAYVGDNGASNNFRIVDISDPSSLVILSTSTFGANVSSIQIAGRYAYVLTRASSNNFRVIDISNPSIPIVLSTSSFGTNPNILKISGNYAYISDNTSGNNFIIINISDPAYPFQISAFSTGYTSITSMQVFGNYAFIGKSSAGNNFKIINISNPLVPVAISTSSFGGSGIYSVEVSGNKAYLGINSATDNFLIIDITNPVLPVQKSTSTFGSARPNIKISGRYAYVGNNVGTNNFRIIDISSSINPIEVFYTTVGSFPVTPKISGRYVYLGTGDATNNFKIIDITGIEVSSLIAHSAEMGNLQVRNDIVTQGIGQFGSLNVGVGGLLVNGSLSVSATNSPSYFGGGILSAGTYGGTGWNGGSLGIGTRLMWIPSKAAFRAGYIDGTQWDAGNIGDYSTVFGYNNKVTSTFSFVGGGDNNIVLSNNSAIIGGSSNQIINNNSERSFIGGGYNNTINEYAWSSFIGGGESNEIKEVALNSFIAGGYDNLIKGGNSFIAASVSSTIRGFNSAAFGVYVNVSSSNSFGFNLGNNPIILNQDHTMAIMGGNVGIGTAYPSTTLHVVGLGSRGATVMRYLCITSAGATYYSTNACDNSSDLRLKKNVVTISNERNVIEDLNLIRGVYFNWDKTNSYNKDASDKRQIGVIAQEIEMVLPELVDTDPTSTYKSVNYSYLTGFLIEVAKAQQAEIEALRETVSTTLNIQQVSGQLVYENGDLDLQNYALLNVKNITGANDKWAIDENGQFITKFQTSDGNTKEMFAMQSPYSEFVFSSSSQLVNGEAIINFDTSTCELIDETQSLKVNITLTGECGGIFVKEKTATGFVVRELNNGTSTSTFDWMVIAKRKIVVAPPPTPASAEATDGQDSPQEGGEDEVISPPLQGGEEGVVETPTSTEEIIPEPLSEEPTSTPEIIPEPPVEESTTTPEVISEPLIEESNS